MIPIEKFIHDLIGDYPIIRKPLVLAYQMSCSFIPAMNYINAEIVSKNSGYFFGFHDKCPWSCDDKMLLAHKYDTTKPLKSAGKYAVDVGYFTGGDFDKFTSIGTTNAWNWQQGSSLQWVDSNFRVAYNDIEDGMPVARILDINTGNDEEINFHIMSVSNDGLYAACCSFDRFGKAMPGYGYASLKPSESLYDSLPEDDALVILRLSDYSVICEIKLCDFMFIDNAISVGAGYHFFSHCLFSPDSKRIAFFCRCLEKSGKLRTRLFSADVNGKDIWRFPGELHSHISWIGNDAILSYCAPVGCSWGFYIHKEFSDFMIPVGCGILTSDGHPQVSNDKRYVLVDTYPDRSRNQRIIIYDMLENKSFVLLKFQIPFIFRNEIRCDYHPRWSRNNAMICFDSAHTGVRSLYIINNPIYDQ